MSATPSRAAVGWSGRFIVQPRRGEYPQPALCAATVVENRRRAAHHWHLRLHAPAIAYSATPGQFVMLTAARAGSWDPVLPRPMAIFARDPGQGWIDIVYGVIGRGTECLTTFRAGETMTTVGPLGRGFDLSPSTTHALLLGRGIGTCSLTMLASDAAAAGIALTAVDSARSADALAGAPAYARIASLRCLAVTDADSSSNPGRLAGRLRSELSSAPPQQIFVCGSQRLLRRAGELAAMWGASIQVAIEAHMACGLGYCHGCASGHTTADAESPLVCRDGPVFKWVPD